MDNGQLSAFLAPMLDCTVIGANQDVEVFGGPICPALRGAIDARLGNDAPGSAYEALRTKHKVDDPSDSAIALAGLFEGIAADLRRKPSERKKS